MQRRVLEVVAWMLIVAVLWWLDLATQFASLGRENNLDMELKRRLVVEQVTSGIAALIMVGFVLFWLRAFPLTQGQLLRSSAGHLVGTLLFALGHFFLLVLLRAAFFPSIMGRDYLWRGNIANNFLFEYQKDIKIYFGMVAIVAAYRYWKQQGVARPKEEPTKLLVQTGRGERLLELRDIDCFTAARNYVSIFTGDREYVVRETLTNLARRVPDDRFLRCHRSHIVNIDRIAEMRSTEAGRHILLLDSGREVPVGRSFRDEFRTALDRRSA